MRTAPAGVGFLIFIWNLLGEPDPSGPRCGCLLASSASVPRHYSLARGNARSYRRALYTVFSYPLVIPLATVAYGSVGAPCILGVARHNRGRAVMGRRTSRKSVARARGEGLREERKALAVRYTIDAYEDLRRETFAPASENPVAAQRPAPRAARAPSSPSARPDPGAASFVIELRETGFWWRWTVFNDLSVGDDSALALRSLEAVAASAVPRWSARSARRAAERAARAALSSAVPRVA
jgi:hypothetical protein